MFEHVTRPRYLSQFIGPLVIQFTGKLGSIPINVDLIASHVDQYTITIDIPGLGSQTVDADGTDAQQAVIKLCGRGFADEIPERVGSVPHSVRSTAPLARLAGPAATGLTAGHGSLYFLAADVNGDGIVDTVTIASGKVTVNVIGPSGSALATNIYKVDGNAANVVAADFDGDGKIDLAVTDAYYDATGGTVQILWGNGDGSFGTPQSVNGGASPSSLAVADFNGDGKPDLAVANPDTKMVAILINSGSRSFAPPVSYAAGMAPSSLVAADFTGDRVPDVAVLDSTGSGVAVLPGVNGGSLGAAVSSAGGNSRGGGGILAYADLNQDGIADLVAAYQNDNILSVLISAGNGTFRPAANYVGDTDMESIAILPFLDGTAAVFTTDKISSSVHMTLAPGDGTLAAPPIFRVGGTLTAVAAVDVNGDKIPDLISTGSNGVGIQIGDGQGGFGAPTFFQTSGSAVAMVAADFNKDGATDLAIATAGHIAVYLNSGAGTFHLAGAYAAGPSPVDLRVGDFNHDGVPDLAELDSATNGQGAVWILPGTGGGVFGMGASYAIGAGTLFSFAVADLNGDGIPDVAATVSAGTAGDVEILLANPNGTLRAPVPIVLGYPASVATADFNSDGKMDLAVSGAGTNGNLGITILLGNGAGAFGIASFIATNSAGNLTAVDLNGDGRADLLNTSCCGETDITYLLGNGDGSLQSEVHIQSGASPVAAAVADLDGDGKPDIAVIDRSGYTLGLFNGFLNMVTESAADPYTSVLAPESLAVATPTATGPTLATQPQAATSIPLPSSINGTSVNIVDSTGTRLPAPTYFVSGSQVYFEIPQGTALGPALVTITNPSGVAGVSETRIANVSPGLFALNAAGLAAAEILRISATGTQTYQSVYQATNSGSITALPINLSPSTDQVYLIVFGTGLRNAPLSAVTATVGGVNATVASSGAEGLTAGLDQMNVLLPSSLAGAGDVQIAVTVSGVAANPVRVTIQ